MTLVQEVSRVPRVEVTGMFYRHCSARNAALQGFPSGRWGPGGFPVLYLGRPVDAVVAEAYRWLVDDIEGMTGGAVAARTLLTVEVRVTQVLDIRAPQWWQALGLSDEDVHSAPRDRDAYQRCGAVAAAAHQLEAHGILAPAASRLGETLALFTRHAGTAGEVPRIVEQETWTGLPPDPRQLRVVSDDARASGGN